MGAAKARIPLPPNVSEEELRTLAAVKLFEVGLVSLGQAAALAGHSFLSVVEVLARFQVPVINYQAEDLENDILSGARSSPTRAA
jgi:predicted HTH domain antitoxin